ncbi:MAG TPA: CDP-alcohol phosphatidyltransferase family protein [Vicinamibacterales bacterium]|nr:CDP-alcohol phosphatidyltransferase family protein [Vicinamibacterales bacterium]
MSATHVRHHNSVLAAAEKRALIWIASRLPRWINSDHLSMLGLSAMAGAGISFWIAGTDPVAGAGLVVLCLVLNWFGDSLDGTLARVRDQQRPRYGYYVDHVIDLAGTAMLFAGLAASGYMSVTIATLVVAAFFLVSAETYLATHARGVFKMAFGGVGPTELRLLLAAGALALITTPIVEPFGLGPFRLWDVGGIIGATGMLVTFVISSGLNTRALYLEETRPR